MSKLNLQKLELLKDTIQQAIDRGATSVEQVHQHIAELPFDFLERVGLLKEDKLAMRERQRRTIGMVYDAIRRITHQIGELISDQFENLEDAQHVAEVIDTSYEAKSTVKQKAAKARPSRKAAKAPAAKKATAKRAVKKAP
jgi:uncharacterized damage-inducible protein DinB